MDHSRAWRTASTQRWLITSQQLREAGFSRTAIRHRVRTGRLWPVFAGVFAVGHPSMTPERSAHAAVLACGKRSALGLFSAAVHLGSWEAPWPRSPQVLVPTTNGLQPIDGIDRRRTPTLHHDDVVLHRGIPTTTLQRTICDCAHTLDDRGIAAMIRQAQRKHKLPLWNLRTYTDARPSKSHRHARVRRVLDHYLSAAALTASEREALFIDLCRTHGIPLPEPQYRLAGYKADFAWPHLRLVVELDDRESHEGAIQFGEDVRRDRAFLAAGFQVLRFTVAELLLDPGLVAREVLAALARRRVA